MDQVEMRGINITTPILAIVQFGPATPSSGFRAGEYYQVTIDPNMASPSGRHIRFGLYRGDEINGWQRCAAMTIVEDLGLSNAPLLNGKPDGYEKVPGASVQMAITE